MANLSHLAGLLSHLKELRFTVRDGAFVNHGLAFVEAIACPHGRHNGSRDETTRWSLRFRIGLDGVSDDLGDRGAAALKKGLASDLDSQPEAIRLRRRLILDALDKPRVRPQDLWGFQVAAKRFHAGTWTHVFNGQAVTDGIGQCVMTGLPGHWILGLDVDAIECSIENALKHMPPQERALWSRLMGVPRAKEPIRDGLAASDRVETTSSSGTTVPASEGLIAMIEKDRSADDRAVLLVQTVRDSNAVRDIQTVAFELGDESGTLELAPVSRDRLTLGAKHLLKTPFSRVMSLPGTVQGVHPGSK